MKIAKNVSTNVKLTSMVMRQTLRKITRLSSYQREIHGRSVPKPRKDNNKTKLSKE